MAFEHFGGSLLHSSFMLNGNLLSFNFIGGAEELVVLL